MTAKANDAREGTGRTWHDDYPHLGRDPLPVEQYLSQEQFDLEREHIFRKTWLSVGRVEQIPNAGDYFVQDIAMLHTSVIIMRGKDNAIRAFHNVCSHRGNKLLWDKQGSCQAITCRLHSWAYELDGALRFVPDEGSFFNLDRKKLGLTPIKVDVWEGFVFVNLDPAPAQTLPEYLGELGTSLHGYPFLENSATSASWTAEVNANWKLIKDGFQEVYHVPFLHRKSIPDAFTSKENPFAHVLHMELLGEHARTSLFGNAALKPTPVAGAAFMRGSFAVRKDFSVDQLPPGVNPSRSTAWAFDLNIVFPALILAVSEGSYFTHQFWPVAVDRTIWTATQYFPRARTPGQRFSQEYGHVIFRDVVLEDGRILEETQSVIGSGAKSTFMLHDEELLVRHSQDAIMRRTHGHGAHAKTSRNEQGGAA
jgi:phenylpropionate dioxygenase-like ring-hydroxylating dioxygenase large terminal subunit